MLQATYFSRGSLISSAVKPLGQAEMDWLALITGMSGEIFFAELWRAAVSKYTSTTPGLSMTENKRLFYEQVTTTSLP